VNVLSYSWCLCVVHTSGKGRIWLLLLIRRLVLRYCGRSFLFNLTTCLSIWWGKWGVLFQLGLPAWLSFQVCLRSQLRSTICADCRHISWLLMSRFTIFLLLLLLRRQHWWLVLNYFIVRVFRVAWLILRRTIQGRFIIRRSSLFNCLGISVIIVMLIVVLAGRIITVLIILLLSLLRYRLILLLLLNDLLLRILNNIPIIIKVLSKCTGKFKSNCNICHYFSSQSFHNLWHVLLSLSLYLIATFLPILLLLVWSLLQTTPSV
jgi:hypothetical protein